MPDILAQAMAADRDWLLESEAKDLLASCGVRVPRAVTAATPAALREAATGLRFPVVVKVLSPDIVHKSEVGGVRIGVADGAAIEEAAADLLAAVAAGAPGARVAGLLAEDMAPAGVELIAGMSRDPVFGELLLFGIGGVLTEVYQDITFRALPLTLADAAEMLDELQAAPLLRGFRHVPAPDRRKLVELLLALGGEEGFLCRYGPRLAEFECNPVVGTPDGTWVLDAKVRLLKRGCHGA